MKLHSHSLVSDPLSRSRRGASAAPGRRLLFTLVASAALAACGGGGAGADDTDSIDQPDEATQTAADERLREIGRTQSEALSAVGSHARVHRFPGVVQENLVANRPGYRPQIVEPALREAWGIAIRPAGLGGHFWVGSTGAGQSIQYVGDVKGTPLFQDELKVVSTAGAVTGISFNPGSQFQITQPHANGPITAPAKFMFANLTGTLSAWTERKRGDGGFDHPAEAVTVVDGRERGSAFVGVTMSPSSDRMYAADFGAQPALRVYDGAFNEVGELPDPYPAGDSPKAPFVPFNVQTLGDRTFAMYGRHAALGPVEGLPKEGRLAEFDAQGQLVARWPGRGMLNYPWGVALAPKHFGLYAGCLLVGNFGDGTIVAFDPKLKVALDYVRDADGRRVVIERLWALQFGNGASLGEADDLYFAAGPNGGADGLFGKLERNPRTLPALASLSLCRASAAS